MNQRQNIDDNEAERDELLRKRLAYRGEKKMFRDAYVFKIGFNYSGVAPYCEKLVLATDGFGDHVDTIREKLEESMADFDPYKDIMLPAGRPVDQLFASLILYKKLLEKEKKDQSYIIGLYLDYDYRFYRIYLDSSIDSYEIIK